MIQAEDFCQPGDRGTRILRVVHGRDARAKCFLARLRFLRREVPQLREFGINDS
jgi:hypothetical protein